MASSASRNGSNLRIYILCGFLVLWCGAISLRLVYLQIFRYGDYEQRAQRQQQRSMDVSPKRGVIYDRAGRELAMSMSVDSIFAVPTEIPDLASTLSLVARITRNDPRELLSRCEAGKTFCWITRKADVEIADRVRALNLRGIHFQKESKRFYPKRELAAQVLGYVSMDDKGLSGIERKFDYELQGTPGRMMISVDARKKWFGSVEKQPEPGDNVVLTIDEKIQYIAERELETAMQETRAESGTVVVQNPRTGEILALANRPTFNPNVSREITPGHLVDHAVSDVYEPGSTFKIVTIAAALEEKLVRPEEQFDCQMGSIVVNGHRIRDWKPYGVLSVSDILAHSSDVGAIKIALRLGDDRFYKYIRAFGFGQQTGIELPYETRGLSKPVSRWSKVSIGAISMGQEIGVSPLQLSAMVSTIANDGVWVAPRIVAATTQPQNAPQTIAFHPQNERRVLSTTTAAQMKQMLQGVVLHGTGKRAILEGYSSAGKTGTAQKIDPATKTYSRTKHIASFAGFAPVNNPAISVVVILDSPVGEHHGGTVGAPVFHRIAQQVLDYLHTPYDVELPPHRQVLMAKRQTKEQDLEEGSPDRLGENLDVADAEPPAPPVPASELPAVSSKPSAERAGNGIVAAAFRQEITPPASSKTPASAENRPPDSAIPASSPEKGNRGTVVLEVEQGGIVVPSFVGKSLRSAIELAQANSLELAAVGSGRAQDQTPAAGAHVAAGTRIVVKFTR
ncbi:MAG: transpeptidase family protein [Acidobacteria bacterium]|nr:transpeptidase family protein [Acidobacteriota bacterium]